MGYVIEVQQTAYYVLAISDVGIPEWLCIPALAVK